METERTYNFSDAENIITSEQTILLAERSDLLLFLFHIKKSLQALEKIAISCVSKLVY
jgi:hypothetical protein